MHFTYAPTGVCSTKIDFDVTDGRLHNVTFQDGCDGNLKAIGRLVEGMDAEKVAALLSGNACEGGPTSCADQLARAIEKALG